MFGVIVSEIIRNTKRDFAVVTLVCCLLSLKPLRVLVFITQLAIPHRFLSLCARFWVMVFGKMTNVCSVYQELLIVSYHLKRVLDFLEQPELKL